MTEKDHLSQSKPEQPEPNARTMANDLLVNAILKGWYQDSATSTAERVTRAINELEKSQRTIFFNNWAVKLTSAVAAVIVICFAVTIFNTTPTTAYADFSDVLASFDLGDKTYQIDICDKAKKGQDSLEEPAQRYTFKSPRRGNLAKRLDGAKLYIRQNQYVIKYRTARGRGVTKGYDGKNSWLIKHVRRQSFLINDPNSIRSELPEHIHSLLFMNLREILHQIEQDYTLAAPTQNRTDDQEHLDYYIADRISQRGKMPERVELWYNRTTNQIQQIIFTGLSFYSPRTPRHTLQITLLSTDPLSEDWFIPETHQ